MSHVFGREPLSPKGRWVAIAVATAALQFSYWPTVVAAQQAAVGEDEFALVAGLGLGAVPFVFMILAFTTRHPQAPTAVLRAMGLFALVGLPLGLLHVAAGVSAGYGAGAVAALRREPAQHPRSARIGAVTGAAVAVLFATTLGGDAGVVLGALIPFVAPAAADAFSEARRDRSE